MTPRRYLAALTISEIEEFLVECCFFLDASRIASALARGCTEDELRIVTREIWLLPEDEE